ncbi:MAG: HAD family phosphatase [Clostridiales bacterium]|nr:HAD family phosphatase [Clostridiales bacterium]
MLRLVIFDMDGLMFDTEQATFRAFMETVARWGYEPKREQFLQFLGLNAQAIQKKYCEFYAQDIDAAELYRQVGERREEILKKEGLPVKEGLAALLDVLDEKRIKKAVASGSGDDVILKNLNNADLTERFNLAMSTDHVERGKPHPDIFLEICQRLRVKPEETLVLEDAASGVQAALAGGIPVVNVPDMIPIPETLQEQCLAVVDSLTDVIPLLPELL